MAIKFSIQIHGYINFTIMFGCQKRHLQPISDLTCNKERAVRIHDKQRISGETYQMEVDKIWEIVNLGIQKLLDDGPTNSVHCMLTICVSYLYILDFHSLFLLTSDNDAPKNSGFMKLMWWLWNISIHLWIQENLKIMYV